MRNKIILSFLPVMLLLLGSCKKEENKIFFEGATAPVLTASVTNTIPLSFATQNDEAIALSWTNPDYQFTTGTSSQDVTYLIEIDTTGSNFTNPARQSISVAKEMDISFTVSEFNDFLLNQLVLDSLMPHNIEIRVTASIGGAVPMHSNVLTFTGVQPYAIPPKVVPPASGKLFITGAATPAGWQCGCGEAELASQQFTQMSPTLYVLPSIALVPNQSYLLLPRYGTWSAVPPDPEKYGGIGANNTNNPNGDDFKALGGDLISPAVGGNYKIEVDFQRGKFTLTKL